MSNTIKIKDKLHNTEVVVPMDEVGPLVKSGRYELPLGKTMPVLNPDGDLGEISTEQYTEALDAGYVPATSVDIQKKIDKDTYGDSPLQTAVERAAGAASFGLTDFAASKIAPHYAEEMAKREEYNPVSAFVGEAAGVIGPALLTGGTSTAAKVISAPAKVAEKIAAKTTAAIAKTMPKNALATKIISEMVPRAAGMGVEGALYGAGSALSDVSLGNIDATTEAVLGEIGLNTFLGAGLGAGIGAASLLVKPVVQKVTGFGNVKALANEYAGLGTKTAQKKIAGRGIQDSEVADLLVNKMGLQVTDNSDDILAKLSNLQDDAGSRIGAALEQMKQADPQALPSIGDFRKKLFGSLDEMAEELRLNGKAIVGETDKVNFLTGLKSEIDDMFGLTGLAKKELDNAVATKLDVDSLQRIRQSLDSNAKFASTAENFKPDVYKELRKPVREMLDEVAENVSPELKQALKQANRDYFISTSIEPFLKSKLTSTANKYGFDIKDAVYSIPALMSGHGAFIPLIIAGKKTLESQMGKNARLIYSMKLAEQNTAKNIGKSMHNFFVSGTKAVRPVLYKFNQNKKQSEQDAYETYAEKVRKYAENPEIYLQEINAKNVDLHREIPNIVANAEVKGINAINFLNSKLPRQKSEFGVINRPFRPTSQQLAKFARYAEIVENPKAALQHLQAGTLTKENVEALKAVYPEIYKQVVSTAATYIDKYGAKLPYNKKVQLGLVLGVPIDASMTTKALRNFQSGYLQQPDQNSGAVNSTVTGLKELDKSNRMMGKEQ